MTDIVARYVLKFRDLASRGILRTAATARTMSRGLETASTRLAAVATAGAVAGVALTNSVAARADEFGKLARQVDFSAQSLQQMDFIAQRQGASVQGYRAGIETFTKRVGELRAGTGALNAVLKKMDPAFAENLKGAKSNEEAYNLLLQKIASIPDAQQKSALASAAVSKRGARDIIRIVDGGSEALKQLRLDSERFRPPLTAVQIAAAERYADQMFNASEATKSLGDVIGTALMPVLGDAAQRFAEFVSDPGNRQIFVERVATAADSLGTALNNLDFAALARNAQDLAGGIGNAADSIGTLVAMAGGIENVAKLLAGIWLTDKALRFGGAVGKVAGGVGALISKTAGSKIAAKGLPAEFDRSLNVIDRRYDRSRQLLSKGFLLTASTLGVVNALNEVDKRIAATAARLDSLGVANSAERATGIVQASNRQNLANLPGVAQLTRLAVAMKEFAGVSVSPEDRTLVSGISGAQRTERMIGELANKRREAESLLQKIRSSAEPPAPTSGAVQQRLEAARAADRPIQLDVRATVEGRIDGATVTGGEANAVQRDRGGSNFPMRSRAGRTVHH